jgi:hypothetical protein
MQALPVEPEGRAEHPVAEPRRAPDDRVEHRLRVSRRTGDDPEDLRRRRLLLQRFGQVLVPALQLLEEPHILDRDDGLVGEGPHQLDLFIAEGLDLRPPDRDDSDDGGFPEHRDGEDCADLFAALTRSPTVFGVRQDVRDVNDPLVRERPNLATQVGPGDPDRADGVATPQHRHYDTAPVSPYSSDLAKGLRYVRVAQHVWAVDNRALADRPCPHGVGLKRDRVEPPKLAQRVRRRLAFCHDIDERPVEPIHQAIPSVADADGMLSDRLEDRLEIGRRARDHPQDLGRGGLLLQRLGHLGMSLCERSVLLL